MSAGVAVQVAGRFESGAPGLEGAGVSGNVAAGLKRLRNATTGAEARMDSRRLTRPSRAALPRWCGPCGVFPQPVEAYPDTDSTFSARSLSMRAQAEVPAGVLFAETLVDLWPYRDRTVALLKRYGRASVEVGRLPSLLGREFFRARVTSYSMASFEDVVIFVHDVETALSRLNSFHQKLVAMSILEQYSLPEVARLMRRPLRTVERELPDALDMLSGMFLEGGLLKDMYPRH